MDFAFADDPGWPVVPRPNTSLDCAPSIWMEFWRRFAPPPERYPVVVDTCGTSWTKSEKLRFSVGRRRSNESEMVLPVPVLEALITASMADAVIDTSPRTAASRTSLASSRRVWPSVMTMPSRFRGA